MAKTKREEGVLVGERIDGDAYEAEVVRLRKRNDWEGAARYSREFERRIADRIRLETATEAEKRLRLQALLNLQADYTVLERPKERVQAALEYHRSVMQLSVRDPLGDHFSYTSLGDAYVGDGQPERARETLLCAGASVMTRWQAEWLSVALDELSTLERRVGDEKTATVIADLAQGIKRAAGIVHRRERKARAGQPDAEVSPPDPE